VGPACWSAHGVYFSALPVYGNVAVFCGRAHCSFVLVAMILQNV
jgi:hypothetical protein